MSSENYILCDTHYTRFNVNMISAETKVIFTIEPVKTSNSDIYIEIFSEPNRTFSISGILNNDKELIITTTNKGMGRVFLKNYPLNCRVDLISRNITIHSLFTSNKNVLIKFLHKSP